MLLADKLAGKVRIQQAHAPPVPGGCAVAPAGVMGFPVTVVGVQAPLVIVEDHLRLYSQGDG